MYKSIQSASQAVQYNEGRNSTTTLLYWLVFLTSSQKKISRTASTGGSVHQGGRTGVRSDYIINVYSIISILIENHFLYFEKL